jgi:hypothetical protein
MSASLAPDFQKEFSPSLAAVPVKRPLWIPLPGGQVSPVRFMLKIDVEGHEKEVLDGAKVCIAELRPDIIIEVWSSSILVGLTNCAVTVIVLQDYQSGLTASDVVTLTRHGGLHIL